MAKSVAAVEVQIDGGKAINSMGDLKRSLKEANFEVFQMREKFGETSVQAIEAAKKVAGIKDAIGDAKAMSDTFNPDQKFKAFSETLSVVAGGFAAVQGAQALLGSESEDLQKALVKVQGAMALSQGLSELGKAGDAFKNLKGIVIDTYKSMSTAAVATGIGVLGVAVGLLIANWNKLFGATSLQKKVQDELVKSTEEYTKAAGDARQKVIEVGNSFDLAKKGVISKKQALDTYNDTLGDSLGKATSLDQAEKLYASKANIYVQIQGMKAQANALFARSAQLLAESQEAQLKAELSGKKGEVSLSLLGKIGDAVLGTKSSYIDLDKLEKEQIAKTTKNNTDLANALENKAGDLTKNIENLSKQFSINTDYTIAQNKKAETNTKKTNKEVVNDTKKLVDDLQKVRDENFLNSITDEDEKAKETLRINMFNRQKEIENSVADEKVKAQLLHEESVKYWAAVKVIDDKAAAEKSKKEQEDFDAAFALLEEENQKELDLKAKQLKDNADLDLEKANNDKLSFEQRLQAIKDREALENQIHFNSQEERTKFEKENADARKKISEEEVKVKKDTVEAIANLMGTLSDVIGKDTKVGKALAIAQATINTYLGASNILTPKYTPGIPIAPQFIQRLAQVAAVLATGFKTVKGIVAVKVPGGSGGGGGASVPNMSTSAPVGPQLSSTALNQQMINQMSAATTRAFVLESDVSGNQERITRLNRAARIN